MTRMGLGSTVVYLPSPVGGQAVDCLHNPLHRSNHRASPLEERSQQAKGPSKCHLQATLLPLPLYPLDTTQHLIIRLSESIHPTELHPQQWSPPSPPSQATSRLTRSRNQNQKQRSHGPMRDESTASEGQMRPGRFSSREVRRRWR